MQCSPLDHPSVLSLREPGGCPMEGPTGCWHPAACPLLGLCDSGTSSCLPALLLPHPLPACPGGSDQAEELRCGWAACELGGDGALGPGSPWCGWISRAEEPTGSPMFTSHLTL